MRNSPATPSRSHPQRVKQFLGVVRATAASGALLAGGLLVISGCGGGYQDADMAGPPAPPSNSEPSTEPDAEPAAAAAEAQNAPETERVVAEAGVGKRGQSLANDTGVVVESAKALFKVEQRAVFEFQIGPVMQLYKASHGEAPQSHEEFMREIIQANQIKLPVLPEGQRYVYDPQTEQLMVERPKQAAGN